jgi:hypothetical protein
MDLFRLLYVERLKPSAIAAVLNRQPSSIIGELEKRWSPEEVVK